MHGFAQPPGTSTLLVCCALACCAADDRHRRLCLRRRSHHASSRSLHRSALRVLRGAGRFPASRHKAEDSLKRARKARPARCAAAEPQEREVSPTRAPPAARCSGLCGGGPSCPVGAKHAHGRHAHTSVTRDAGATATIPRFYSGKVGYSSQLSPRDVINQCVRRTD